MDSGVHWDAPGQRHGQQPRLRDGPPTEGQNEQWREANRRRQRQTIRYRGLVPNPPPQKEGTPGPKIVLTSRV